MSEEEIIKNIKEMIQWSDHNIYKIALQGILDLYEQEKARNKDLEKIEYIKRNFDYCLEQKIKEGIELKVKEKIEELNKEEKKALKGTKGQDRYSIKLEYMHKRNALQELLEESEK